MTLQLRIYQVLTNQQSYLCKIFPKRITQLFSQTESIVIKVTLLRFGVQIPDVWDENAVSRKNYERHGQETTTDIPNWMRICVYCEYAYTVKTCILLIGA